MERPRRTIDLSRFAILDAEAFDDAEALIRSTKRPIVDGLWDAVADDDDYPRPRGFADEEDE